MQLAKRRKTENHVGVLLDFGSTMAREFARGIMRYSRIHGPWVILADFRSPLSPASLQLPCRGVIGMFYDPSVIAWYQKQSIPIVNLSSGMPEQNLPTVRADNRLSGCIAAEHLIERGFGHLAFIGKDDGAQQMRREGFIDAAAQAGVRAQQFQNDAGGGDWSQSPGKLGPWLLSLPKPIGVMAGDEMTGWTVIGTSLDNGLEVPEEVAVISAGNEEIVCESSDVPLTSVLFPGERIGFEGATLLDRLMHGQSAPVEPLCIPPVYVATRQSTDILAIDDKDIARAVRYIREHACNGIGVMDVMRDVPVDRRWLERQFRKRLGRSLMEEIYRVRINRARMMLSESEIPLPKVAEQCGFGQIKSFGLLFRQMTGWTPAAFRRNFRHRPQQPQYFSQTSDPGNHPPSTKESIPTDRLT